MRPQETRRIVLGVPLSAVAAACMPDISGRRPEDSWPTLRVPEAPSISFRYPPEGFNAGVDGVSSQSLLSNGHIATTYISARVVRVRDYEPNPDLEDLTLFFTHGEVLLARNRSIAGRNSKFVVSRMEAETEKIAVGYFIERNRIYYLNLYFLITTSANYGNRVVNTFRSMGSYLRDYPKEQEELKQRREQLIELFDRIIGTVQLHED